MVIGVRVDPAVEQRLDALAERLGKSRSACIREAINQFLLRHGDGEEARLEVRSVHQRGLKSLYCMRC